MKRIKGLLLLLPTICLLLFTKISYADEMLVGFSDPGYPEDSYCKELFVGQEFEVKMWVRGANYTSVTIYLQFESSMIEYKGCSGGVGNLDCRYDNGNLRVFDYYNSGSGTFNFSIRFKALKSGKTYVKVNQDKENLISIGRDDVTSSTNLTYPSDILIQEAGPNTPSQPPAETWPPEYTWGPWVVIREATYDQEGLERRTGTKESNLGNIQTDTQERTIPKLTPPTQAPTRQASTDACLSQLSIGGGSLQPAFNPNTFEYRMNMDPETGVLQVRYATRDERAEAFYWPYNVVLPYGQTTFTIRVTAEDGIHQNDYTVIINKPQPAAASTEAQTEESTEETTEESTEETSEAVTTERTLPEPTEAEIFYNVEAIRLKILPLPEGFEIPEDYRSYVLHSAGGESMDCLAPKGVRKTDHYI